MPAAFYILFGAAFTVTVSAALGKLLLRGLKLRLFRQEEHVLAFFCGAPLLSLLTFAICAAGVARKGVLLGAGAAILLFGWRAGVHRPVGEPLPPLPRLWKRLFTGIYLVFAVLYFFNAMAPEISPDGSAYHLALVARYLREHGFHPIATNMYANLSQGVELLYVVAFAFGRHSAAALVHCAFLLALPLAILCYARRAGFPLAGVCAAVLVFASPAVGIDGISAYIDVAVAGIAFTVFYLLEIWDAQREAGWMAPIGLAAGFAYAAKYTAGLAIPYAVGFVLVKTFRKQGVRLAAVVALCAAIMVLPWMLRNWLWFHNPVSPFANALFPNPYVTIGFEEEYRQWLRTYDLKSRAEIPLEVTVKGSLSGLLGPLFLLAPVGLLALRRREGRRLWLAALVFGAAYGANIGTRFLIPPLPFVALAMALEFARWQYLALAAMIAHAVLSWPNAIPLYCGPAAWRLMKIPYREALRIKSEESWLTSNLPGYQVARLVENMTPLGSTIFGFTPVPEAYTTRNYLVSFQSASNLILKDMLLSPLVSDLAPTWHLRFVFPGRGLRRVRVVQTAADPKCNWSISEFRVFWGGRELERAAEWRLRAHPNPWDVQMAFDNNPATRWRSQRNIYPGMWVEVDFGRPTNVDLVLLESTHDQYAIKVKLEGQDAAGRWTTLAAAPEEIEAPPNLGLRRAATQELKLRGVDYLLVFDEDFKADDFRGKADLWGIRQIGERNHARLYKLEASR